MILKTQYFRIRIIFFIASITLLVFSVMSYVRIKNLIEGSEFVNHATTVKLRLEKIFATLNEVESSQRGYMLTKDSVFFRDAIVATTSLNNHLNDIESFTKDNSAQLQNVSELRAAINKRLEHLNSLVALSRTSNVSIESRLRGKTLMYKVHTVIHKMEDEEDKLLSARSESLNQSVFVTPLYTIVLMIGSIVILGASYFKIIQELKISDNLKSEIENSEQRIHTILEYAPDAVITIDEKGIITSWNPQAENIFGWTEKEVLGKTLTETIIPERYREQHKSGIKRFLKTGEGPVINKPIEIFAVKKDTNEFPVELKISSSKINDRDVFIGFVRDISVRKKVDEALKNKTTQLVEAQHLAHIGSWEWDVPANKIDWSDELYRIYGLTPQQFEANYENFLKYIHPDDREFVNGIVQQAFKDQQPFQFSHRVVCPNGTERVVSSTGKVFADSNGNTLRMAGTAQDVTEQKKYETELKESEERFSKIFDSNPIPMTLTEIKTNKIKHANNLFYSTFGYSKEEVLGQTSEELNLIGPEENERVIAFIFDILQEERSVAELQALSVEETEELLIKLRQSDAMKNFEIIYTRKNGETFPAVVSFEIMRFGTERYTIASYQDITERKRVHELLNSQNENLLKINKELESFNYISSHDLQEPLRQIQNFASRIIDDELQNLSDKGKNYFERMNNAANRMQNLIADLLAYSRTTIGDRKFENTDLSIIVEQVKAEFKDTIDEKHATIEMGKMCNADIIQFQFRQLMHNLIGNALKFSNPDIPPHIKIQCKYVTSSKANNPTLTPEKKYCHITITDNGIGFEPQYKERIFEVFQRLHDKQIPGTGIGLAIVKKIVENHNGFITATSQLNSGATFDIYIPTT